MTGLRFLGVVFLLVIVLGLALHLSGAVIVALFFFIGLATAVVVWIARLINRHW